MKLSEIRRVLEENNIRLTKSLGQNFLHDANQLERIIEAAQLSRGDRVLEIGPGLGPLTDQLLARAGEVLAIEKDRRLCEVLKERFPRLKLFHADALEFLRREACDWSEWKVVSNLPYSVASPIIVELAQAAHPPKLIVATLQAEVARRLVAQAGDKDYGVLTLLVQVRYVPKNIFKIPAGCFFPEPEVDSACVTLERRPGLLTSEQVATFIRLVKKSFSQRRKIMVKLLKEDWPAELLEQVWSRLQLNRQARAEAVTLEQFVSLTKLLHSPEAALNEEHFDVVDERDEVIGKAPRKEVHQQGLRHRAVHILLFNFKGQVFLQKRSMQKDTFPGTWDSSASGHLDCGEDYDLCALRELREELGYTPVEPLRKMFKLKACPETGCEFIWVYEGRAEGPFTLQREEIERGGWFTPEEVTRWLRQDPEDFASGFRVLWSQMVDAGTVQ